MVYKIYTYYEDLNSKEQPALLSLWKKNWENRGFKAIVLSESDAKLHSYYEEFNHYIHEIVKTISGGNALTNYGKACYMRWLAYSVQEDERFFVSDFDLINNNFIPTELKDELCFYDWCCPCFASGTPKHFLNFCRDIIDISKARQEEIIQMYKKFSLKCYHDQDFLMCNMSDIYLKKQQIYNLHQIEFKPPKTVVVRPSENSIYESSTQLIHFSHFGVKTVFGVEGNQIDKKRLEELQKIINE